MQEKEVGTSNIVYHTKGKSTDLNLNNSKIFAIKEVVDIPLSSVLTLHVNVSDCFPSIKYSFCKIIPTS